MNVEADGVEPWSNSKESNVRGTFGTTDIILDEEVVSGMGSVPSVPVSSGEPENILNQDDGSDDDDANSHNEKNMGTDRSTPGKLLETKDGDACSRESIREEQNTVGDDGKVESNHESDTEKIISFGDEEEPHQIFNRQGSVQEDPSSVKLLLSGTDICDKINDEEGAIASDFENISEIHTELQVLVRTQSTERRGFWYKWIILLFSLLIIVLLTWIVLPRGGFVMKEEKHIVENVELDSHPDTWGESNSSSAIFSSSSPIPSTAPSGKESDEDGDTDGGIIPPFFHFTARPSESPRSSAEPSLSSSDDDSEMPTTSPTIAPTGKESDEDDDTDGGIIPPFFHFTARPSASPRSSAEPSLSSSDDDSEMPTTSPTIAPSALPTTHPTHLPTAWPTNSPTIAPSEHPISSPSVSPTISPTHHPTGLPTVSPSSHPSDSPTTSSSDYPTITSSDHPTITVSGHPTIAASDHPTSSPSNSPTIRPSDHPTPTPTIPPSDNPTSTPTISPSDHPTTSPIISPSDHPTSTPTISPSDHPTTSPITSPSDHPTSTPTISPSDHPTPSPTISPSDHPTLSPTASPTKYPTSTPTQTPTKSPIFSSRRSPTSSPLNHSPFFRPTLDDASGLSSNGEKKRPNIMVILADDVGTGDIPVYWDSSLVKMPNIDRLARMGVTFRDAHSTPLCAPSRYMFLSGNYQHRGRHYNGRWNLGYLNNQFQSHQKSIAEVLRDQAGYHTAIFGKVSNDSV